MTFYDTIRHNKIRYILKIIGFQWCVLKKKVISFLAFLYSLSVCVAAIPVLVGFASAKDYLHDFDCWGDVPSTQGVADWGSAQCTWFVKTVADTSTHTVYFYCDFNESSYTSSAHTYDISLEISNENAKYSPVFVRTSAEYDAFTIESNFTDPAYSGGAVCVFAVQLKNSRDYSVPNAVSLVLYVNQNQYTIYESPAVAFSESTKADLLTSQTPDGVSQTDGQSVDVASSKVKNTTSASTKFYADVGGMYSTGGASSKFSGNASYDASVGNTITGAGELQTAQDTVNAETANKQFAPAAKIGIGVAVVLLAAGVFCVCKGLRGTGRLSGLKQASNKQKSDDSSDDVLANALDESGKEL